MTILDIIKSTKICGENLKVRIESSFEELQRTIPHISKSTADKPQEPDCKNHSIQFAALGLIALGIIGWFSTDADSVWPKLSVGGGVILSAYDIIRGKNRKNHSCDVLVEKLNPQLSKQDVQQKLKVIIRDVVEEWNEFTNSNKTSLYSLIDESSASSEEKFKATNIVSISRKIQFSILPYVVKIVNAKSANELHLVVKEIETAFINDMAETVSFQINDYQSIANKIHEV